jgi:DIS3-like exonuclease 2
MTEEEAQKGGGGGGGSSNNNRSPRSRGNDGKRATVGGSTAGAGRPRQGKNKHKQQQNVASSSGESKQQQLLGTRIGNNSGRNKNSSGRGSNGGSSSNNNENINNKSNTSIVYPPYKSLAELQTRYNQKDPDLIRGTIRVLPGRNTMSFCTCDRGSQPKDVVLESQLERNRALDGDLVFVELIPLVEHQSVPGVAAAPGANLDGDSIAAAAAATTTTDDDDDDDRIEQLYDEEAGDTIVYDDTASVAGLDVEQKMLTWQDDQLQVDLWDPIVPLERRTEIPQESTAGDGNNEQRRGRVVYVLPPRQHQNEIRPTEQVTARPTRRIVGTLKRLQGGTTLLTSSNKSLDQFRLSNSDAIKFKDAPDDAIFQAKYTYGSWKEDFRWPPCSNIEQFGQSGNVEDETAALLIENDVDHGEFPASVLEECENVVKEGEYSNGAESGWKPTPDMYKGRRDYRKQRIFTMDPTTAKE